MLKNMMMQLIGMNIAVYGMNTGRTWLGLLGIAFMGTFLLEYTIEWRKWLREQRKKEEEEMKRRG